MLGKSTRRHAQKNPFSLPLVSILGRGIVRLSRSVAGKMNKHRYFIVCELSVFASEANSDECQIIRYTNYFDFNCRSCNNNHPRRTRLRVLLNILTPCLTARGTWVMAWHCFLPGRLSFYSRASESDTARWRKS